MKCPFRLNFAYDDVERVFPLPSDFHVPPSAELSSFLGWMLTQLDHDKEVVAPVAVVAELDTAKGMCTKETEHTCSDLRVFVFSFSMIDWAFPFDVFAWTWIALKEEVKKECLLLFWGEWGE
jgi:hypothetical protein